MGFYVIEINFKTEAVAFILWTDKDTSTYGGYGEMAVTHANRKFNNIYMFIYNDSIFI